MDWDKLRIFYAVAQAGSFTHAGDSLGLSQSAISRQIGTLEESIGVSLFHRHARGLLLTEEGELLHKTAGEIFGKMAMIEGQIADSRQLSEGPLRITVAEFIGSTWLAPQLEKLRSKHPDIQLTMLLDDRIYNLGMREADAAIRLYKPEQPDLIQKHLMNIPFEICASTHYLEKNGTPQNAQDTRKHTLIGYPENVPAPFADPNWLFRILEIESDNNPHVIMMNSIYGIFESVKAGAGIGVLPRYLIEKEKTIVPILPNLRRPTVEMYFVYPEERRHSKRIALFRDFLVQSIEKQENDMQKNDG